MNLFLKKKNEIGEMKCNDENELIEMKSDKKCEFMFKIKSSGFNTKSL